MFDFFYVNKIETNLAVQSNSLHVNQKIAPLRRKEPKPRSTSLLSTLPPAFFSNHCISANECPIQSPVQSTAGEELTPTLPPYPKCFLIKIKDMEPMLKVSIIANYLLLKKGKRLSKNLSLQFLSVGL
jgi:hypothetical protein